MVANGQSQELNQVSSTSGTWVKPAFSSSRICSAEYSPTTEMVHSRTFDLCPYRRRSPPFKLPPVSVVATKSLIGRSRLNNGSKSLGGRVMVQTGIRCPHHSCRLMHQSWMFAIQCS